MSTKQADLGTALKLLATLPAAGAGVGGLIGAMRAPKGRRLRTALGDAGVGGMAGLGFALGGTAGGAAGMALGGRDPVAQQQTGASMGGLGAGLGAVGAGFLGHKLREEMDDEYDKKVELMKQLSKTGNEQSTTNNKKDKKPMKKESAFSFGMRAKQALDIDPRALGYGAAGGGLAGALGGGLYGMLNPGEEEDDNGRVRRKSRLGAALRGALGGGALGAVGGAGLGAAAPTLTTDLANKGMSKATEFGNMLRGLLAGKKQTPNEELLRNSRIAAQTMDPSSLNESRDSTPATMRNRIEPMPGLDRSSNPMPSGWPSGLAPVSMEDLVGPNGPINPTATTGSKLPQPGSQLNGPGKDLGGLKRMPLRGFDPLDIRMAGPGMSAQSTTGDGGMYGG